MILREHVSNAEIFRDTLLVHMQFLKLPDDFSDVFQKRKHDMKDVTMSSTTAVTREGSESDDMIKFLAVIRKQGIDIMYVCFPYLLAYLAIHHIYYHTMSQSQPLAEYLAFHVSSRYSLFSS